jgi:hypothetical protein
MFFISTPHAQVINTPLNPSVYEYVSNPDEIPVFQNPWISAEFQNCL